MKRQARPFTVEIKSSRKPVQKLAPVLTGMARTTPSSLKLWPGDRPGQDSIRERGPASLTALDEANRLFGKLLSPARAPVLGQSSDPLSSERALVQIEQPAFKVDDAKADPPGRVQEAERRGSILPDLRRAALESGAPPQITEQRSASPKPHRPGRKKITTSLPRVEVEEQVASDHVSAPQSEPVVGGTGLPHQAEGVAVQQPAAPVTILDVSSAQPRRSGRALDQSWVFRVACRKAKRRGEPLPLRAAQRRKSR
jgi:hypothetical protein